GMRTLLQDVEHKGYIFPKGWKVKYHIDFSNWDKQLWGEDMMSPMSDNAPKSATASNAVFDICSRDLSGMPLVTLLVQGFTVEFLEHETALDGPAATKRVPLARHYVISCTQRHLHAMSIGAMSAGSMRRCPYA
ncbi:hypothetical protein CYMTET_46362, partial [Cymbomonas tetramitiformis]